MANARFQANGVDVLIDAIHAAGETAGDIRERMWQVAWARGFQDLVVPLPVPDVKIEGYAVLVHEFSPHRALAVIDDGEQLIGVLDDFAVPPLGAKVRAVPVYGQGAQWSVKVLAVIGCGLVIRFDDAERQETGWIDRLRSCLQQIRENELAVRRQIENDRRSIVFVTPPAPFRVEMEKADREIRDRVTGGGYTDEETRALGKAKTPDAVQRVVAARNKRLVDAYRAEVVTFRAKIPELRAEYDKKMEAYAAFRQAVDRCNEIDSASRGITDTTLRLGSMLDTIETAVMNVRAVDLGRIEEHPRRNIAEISQTVELLFELLPKRLQKTAAHAAG